MKAWKVWSFALVIPVVGAHAAAELVNPPVRFASTVQWSVRENSPMLVERGQRLLADSFAQAVQRQPMLKTVQYESRRAGNEIVFYVSGTADLVQPLEELIQAMIENAHRRVRARGNAAFYEVSDQADSAFIDVEVDQPGMGVVAVAAHGVRVRDLLEEIQSKIAAVKAKQRREVNPVAWSYSLPGRCARQRIDFRFGQGLEVGVKRPVHSVSEVMKALAKHLNTSAELRGGAWVFSGDCVQENERIEAALWNHPGWVLETVPSAVPAVFLAPAE